MGKRSRRRRREQRGRVAAIGAAVTAAGAIWSRDDKGDLEELEMLIRTRTAVEQCIEDIVDELVVAGVSWARIGAALGVTRQGARQRYLKRHQQRA
jgi:hypothetical protein